MALPAHLAPERKAGLASCPAAGAGGASAWSRTPGEQGRKPSRRARAIAGLRPVLPLPAASEGRLPPRSSGRTRSWRWRRGVVPQGWKSGRLAHLSGIWSTYVIIDISPSNYERTSSSETAPRLDPASLISNPEALSLEVILRACSSRRYISTPTFSWGRGDLGLFPGRTRRRGGSAAGSLSTPPLSRGHPTERGQERSCQF